MLSSRSVLFIERGSGLLDLEDQHMLLLAGMVSSLIVLVIDPGPSLLASWYLQALLQARMSSSLLVRTIGSGPALLDVRYPQMVLPAARHALCLSAPLAAVMAHSPLFRSQCRFPLAWCLPWLSLPLKELLASFSCATRARVFILLFQWVWHSVCTMGYAVFS